MRWQIAAYHRFWNRRFAFSRANRPEELWNDGAVISVAPRWRGGARRFADRLAGVDATRAAMVLVGLLGLALALFQLSRTGALYGVTEYDDGPYFGSAVMLAHGYLPYRDFGFSMMPGITLLMAPVATVARLVGTRVGIAIARLVTAVVAGANCTLAGAIVRHRGASAVLLAGGLLACYPSAVFADHTVLLEPYLSAFCLVSFLLAFTGTGELTRRRALVAGCALGFAGDIKVWAIFVAVPAVVIMAISARPRVRAYMTGIVLGFAVPALPFFLAAPTAMVRDNLALLVLRGRTYENGLTYRLSVTLGTWYRSLYTPSALFTWTILGVVAAVIVLGYAFYLRRTTPGEWLVLGSAATTATALLAAPQFYPHHVYFAYVFIAPALAVASANLVKSAASWLGRARLRLERVTYAVLSAALVGSLLIVAAAVVVPGDLANDTALLSVHDFGPTIAATIPAGSCAISDDPIELIAANRYVSNDPNCPKIADPEALEVEIDGRVNYTAPPGDRVTATWISWFSRARYVLITGSSGQRIPWSPTLVHWFTAHFRLLNRAGIWKRIGG